MLEYLDLPKALIRVLIPSLQFDAEHIAVQGHKVHRTAMFPVKDYGRVNAAKSINSTTKAVGLVDLMTSEIIVPCNYYRQHKT